MKVKILFFTILFFFNMSFAKSDFQEKLREGIKKINHAIVITKLAIGRDPKAKDVPDRYMALSELYIEKAKYLYYMEQEEKQANQEYEIDMSMVNENRRLAISFYNLILDNFPKYPPRDRVLILLANEYNEVEDKDAMIETFKKLLREFPNTPYKKEGNLVLGDHYYDQHQISQAIPYYQKVVEGAPTAITYLAYYKLAWCYINLEKYKTALNYFEMVLKADIEIVSESPFVKRTANVKAEALLDSILCYTNLKETKAEDAADYYFNLAPDKSLYITVLDRLGNRYFTGGEYSNAVIIYRKLITITNNVEKTLLYTSRVWKLLKHLRGTRDVGKEAQLLSRHLLRYKNSWRLPEKDREKFIVDYEMYMRHISTLADKHYRALRGRKKVAKGDQKRHLNNTIDASKQISESYRAYLQSFPDNKRFSAIRKNYSNILYDRKEMLNAGKIFEEISNTDPSIKARKDSLRTAMHCYDHVLKNEKEDLYNKAWARAGIKDLSQMYLKYYPNSKRRAELTYNISRLTFEQGAQDEGVQQLMEFIQKYPSHPLVSEAGHKILDYHNMRTDYKGLVDASKRILAVKGIRNKEFLKQVSEISDGAIRAEVAEQTEELATARTSEEFFVVADRFQGTVIGAESLYNAFNVARLKKNHYLILAAGQKMLSEYPDYRHIKTVKLALADTYLQNLQFVRAAQAIEDAYNNYPKEKGITKLLEDAANIYSLLGEYDKANGLYNTLRKRGVKNASELEFKVAENYFKARRYDIALKEYLNYNSKINSVLSNVKVARTYRAMGQKPQMESFYQRTISRCANRCMGDHVSREAVAEARYYLIERNFDNFMKMRINNKSLDKSVSAATTQFNSLEKAYGEVVALQDPTWAVGGIYRLGEVYNKMSSFLEGARPPKGYNKAQQAEFKKLMNVKVEGLEKEARKIYKTCADKSYELNLFSELALGCFHRSRGQNYRVQERYPAMRRVKSFRGKDIHIKLLHKPFDMDLMQDLAEAYYNGGDYHMSMLIALKILERKNDDDVRAILGNSYMSLGEEQLAYEMFKQALGSDSTNKIARDGISKLYKKYGNPKQRGL